MNAEILNWLMQAADPWGVFLLALWLFRNHIDFRFRPPPGSGSGRGNRTPS